MTRLKEIDLWLLTVNLSDEEIASMVSQAVRDLRVLRWETHRAMLRGYKTGEEAQAVMQHELDSILSVRNPRLADFQRTLRLYLTQKKVSKTTMGKVEALTPMNAHFEEQGRLETEFGLITP
jgi:hypothetical protein